MPNVVISVRASMDADINALFAPIEKRAERARDAIAKSLAAGLKKGLDPGSGNSFAASIRDAVRDAVRDGFQQALKGIKIPASAIPRIPSSQGAGGGPYRGGAGAGAGAQPFIGPIPATPLQALRAQEIALRQQRRQEAAAARAQEKAAREAEAQAAAQERKINRNAMIRYHVAGAVGGAMSNAVGRGLRTAGHMTADVARGAGIRFGLGEYVAANTEADKMAADISSGGYIPGAGGAAEKRRSPEDIRATARKAAGAGAYSENQALEGMDLFVRKTGDLATGEAAIERIAGLARATNSDLGKMMSAAADASSALGDGFGSAEEKAKALYEVMKMTAGEGKLGAVTIKDLATQMVKVTASAGQFGGDRSKNIADLVGVAEVTKKMGGATSATQAGTSVAAFVSQIQTKKHQQAYEALTGKKLYDAQGMLNPINDIIFNIVSKAKGNKAKMADVGGSVASMRALTGYQLAYNQAGGGAAGEAALRAALDQFANSALSDATVAEDLSVVMKSTAMQTQLLNNKMQVMAGELQANIIPKLMNMAPALMSVLDFAANNPGQAAAVALSASIAKAGVGAAVTEAIKLTFAGGAGGGALALGALTVTALSVTLIGDVIASGEKGERSAMSDAKAAAEMEERFKRGQATPEDVNALYADIEQRRQGANQNQDYGFWNRVTTWSPGDLAEQAGEVTAGDYREGAVARLHAIQVARTYTKGVMAGAPTPEQAADLQREAEKIKDSMRAFAEDSPAQKAFTDAARTIKDAFEGNGTLKVRVVGPLLPTPGVTGPPPPPQ